jgi:hypothetical protein
MVDDSDLFFTRLLGTDAEIDEVTLLLSRQRHLEAVADLIVVPPYRPGGGAARIEAGTFSQWGPPSDPLLDLSRCLDAIANLPPASKPLRIVECRDLGSGRFYQERFRFSGGVNLSAIARNTERRIAAEQTDGTVYIEKATGNVYCSPKAAAKLIEQFPDAPRGPEPLELSWTVPMHFESSELMWTMAGRYV